MKVTAEIACSFMNDIFFKCFPNYNHGKWFDMIANVLPLIRKIFSWSEGVCGHITFRQWIHYSWIAEWQIKPLTLPLTPHWLWVRHLFLRQETSAYIFWKLKKLPWDTARVLGYKKPTFTEYGCADK